MKTTTIVLAAAGVSAYLLHMKYSAILRSTSSTSALLEVGGKEYVINTGMALSIGSNNIEYRGDGFVYNNGAAKSGNFYISPF